MSDESHRKSGSPVGPKNRRADKEKRYRVRKIIAKKGITEEQALVLYEAEKAASEMKPKCGRKRSSTKKIKSRGSVSSIYRTKSSGWVSICQGGSPGSGK